MFLKQIIEGLQKDVDKLITDFLQTNSVRFEEFANIWKEMRFSLVYMGKQCEQELHEFTDECFRIALQYLIAGSSFQARVAGLYLLYSLYIKQPMGQKFKVRVTLQQWQNVRAVIATAKRDNHIDACYIWYRLLTEKAFCFVAFPLPLGPRSNTLGEVLDFEASKRFDALLTPFQSFLEEGYLEQLDSVHEQYTKMKEVQPDFSSNSLNLVSVNIFPDIMKKMAALRKQYNCPDGRYASKKGRKKKKKSDNSSDLEEDSEASDEGENDESSCEGGSQKVVDDIGSRRALLRQQQYASQAVVIQSRRHRTTEVARSTDMAAAQKKGRPRRHVMRTADVKQEHTTSE